jgi:hypothetical protein
MPKNRKTIWNFSGGRSSALMTIRGYRDGDIVLFTDTGREHPKTYKFINDFEAHENIPVNRISYKNSSDPFTRMLEDQKKGFIPRRTRRICTSELKVLTARRWLVAQGYRSYEQNVGFRFDEKKRVSGYARQLKSIDTKFPLYDDGITKGDVLRYFAGKPYDLEIPSILGNCTLCFMKGQAAVMAILREFPELADPWIMDEERFAEKRKGDVGSGGKYFENISMRQLKSLAQNNLFKGYPLDEIDFKFSCGCHQA